VVGKFGFPQRSAYSASKHALHGFFETLYTEERQHNIFVTIVFPGRIRTNVSKNAITKTGEPHGKMDEGQEKGMDPTACAKQIIKAVHKRKIELFVGGNEGFMLFFRKFFPRLFFRIAQKISPT
jgi:short-subunit dehydrogenase